MRYIGYTLLLLCLVVLAPVAMAQTVEQYRYEPSPDYRYDNQPWDQLPGTTITPHTAWANPSVYGKLKVLVISPTWTARDTVELSQRISMSTTSIMTNSRELWDESVLGYCTVSNTKLKQTAVKRLHASYRYDVIILGSISWKTVPDDVKELIVAQVNQGSGLIYVNPNAPDKQLLDAFTAEPDQTLATDIANSVPLKALPMEFDMDVSKQGKYNGFPARHVGPFEIKAGKLGTGRVVFVDYKENFSVPWSYLTGYNSSLTPSLEYDPLNYNYYYSILAKAMLFAAKKDIPVIIQAKTGVFRVQRSSLPAKLDVFAVSSKNSQPATYTAYCELKNQDNHVVLRTQQLIDLSNRPVSFKQSIPRLSSGRYMVDLWIKQGRMTVNWGSAAITVSDTQYLESITSSKPYYGKSDAISGEIRWKTKLPATRKARIQLWDTYDRLIEQKTLVTGIGKFSFKPIVMPLSRTYKILAEVLDGDSVVDKQECWVGMPNNAVDDFQFTSWAGITDSLYSRLKLRQLKSMGVTGYYDTTTTWSPESVYRRSADVLARNNMLAIPYCYGAWDFAVNDENPYQKTIDEYTKNIYPHRIEAYRPYGVISYGICEENYISRNDKNWTSAEASKDFRAFLLGKYKTIDTLNTIWKSSFKSFEEIVPVSLMEARKIGQITHWYDQELYKTDRFSGLHEEVAKTIWKIDPGSRISFDCTGGMDFDWTRMMKILSAGNSYPGQELQKGQDVIAGEFTGAYDKMMDEYIMRSAPWRVLLEGGRQIDWWPSDSDNGLGGSSAITPDASEPLLCSKQAAEEVANIRNGAGKVVMSSILRIDPVILLWSAKSYYAGIFNPQDMGWEQSRTGFTNLLRRTGFNPRVVDSEYLETKFKYDEQNRVLVLPCTQALSKVEVDRIRNFIKQGGLVICDFVPGLFDEYMRPYGASGSGGAVTEEVCPTCKGKGKVDSGTTVSSCPTCGGTGKVSKSGAVTYTSALADLFDFSSKSVKQTEKGYGMYLNGFPSDKQGWSALRDVIHKYGTIPENTKITDSAGLLRLDVRGYTFENGQGQILGILPDSALADPPGDNVLVNLPGKYHVYDIRRHQYLGYEDTLRMVVSPPYTNLLALLPERIEGFRVSVSKQTYSPNEVAVLSGQVITKSAKNGKSAARVEVFKNGKIVECWTKNIAFDRSFKYSMPVALNAAKGSYKVRVTEVVSGMTQEVGFLIR